MGSRDHLLCCSGIPEPVLRLPPKCTLHIIGFSPDCSTSTWKVHGSITTKKRNSDTRNKMVVFIESRALQLERACPNHHICKFRFKLCLCCEYYYHSEGFLSPKDSSSCSSVVITNYSGDYWFLLYNYSMKNIAQILRKNTLLKWDRYIVHQLFDEMCRCLAMDGQEFSGSFLLIHHGCGGQQTWFKSPSLGELRSFTSLPPYTLSNYHSLYFPFSNSQGIA